jgi:hypothetical protein
MMEAGESENIRVIVRLRPLPSLSTATVAVAADDDYTLTLTHPGATTPSKQCKSYSFDRVCGPDTTQEQVYELAQPLVHSAILGLLDLVIRLPLYVQFALIAGYNATIFAYGSTGSGKTHTMTGQCSMGVVPRAIRDIFRMATSRTASDTAAMFLVHISYVELYNNIFRNLLHDLGNRNADDRLKKIEIHENKRSGVHLTGPSNLRLAVTNVEQALRFVAHGTRARAVGTTNLNEHSSRSHSILTFHIESRERQSVVRMGKLHLVDLAGSERISLSGAEGDTLVEAQNINLSLTNLGIVLSALSSQSEAGSHSRCVVPYRNSKLTYFLKDSLGGNSKTLMITNLRVEAANYQEVRQLIVLRCYGLTCAGMAHLSLQSLVSVLYSSRAKKIKNRSAINMDTIGDSSMQKVGLDVCFPFESSRYARPSAAFR